AGGLQFGDGARERVGLHVDQHQGHALARGQARELAADARAGAGDHGHLAAQRAHRRRLRAHTAVYPPSTASTWPVMCAPASEANSRAAPLRSSSPPSRRSGALPISASSPSAPITPWLIFEGKKPGAIALTVMPRPPHSAASARVRLTTAPLEAL